ncbi:MAG: carbonic anhydrase family protein [Gammaproteobacteria bacterium]|nr:carbonic anhydrase family protein [Gammaproteobacteria bacterium]
MKKIYIVVYALGIVMTSFAMASGEIHWGYTGHNGPQKWGGLNPAYGLCSTGKNQSPIDVKASVDSKLPAIKFSYAGFGKEILNNGHTVQVNYSDANQIELDGVIFKLKQLHFHTPSENHIKGKSYPLEMHLVHASNDGELAVVAVMFEQGQANTALDKAWSQLPIHNGDIHVLKARLAANELLPKNRDYYRFNGSLTTPPCSEGVRWLVMKDAVKISRAQVETFAAVIHGANNRPLQKHNARIVMY